MKYILLSFGLLLLIPSPPLQGKQPCSTPEEKEAYECRRVRGLKYDKYGRINPTPDVIPLDYLPRDKYGFVDWSKAINDGTILPRNAITDSEPQEDGPIKFSKDILIRSKLPFMPDVIFPHSAHNAWLDCKNCHPKIFKMKAGGTPISMAGIWRGKYCGRCHDRVAFPIRNCFRCHSAPKKY